ncbi:hypothetical protein CGMCC3_g8541 [Colletotrichum fructicola]|nr:uncharacterized protein CGMCC3_g8541 [Colletotrichum fructicola]KAE9575332.1 hypothetical protein CGMCC3_g8541 [Colletotrichum fructicola]
MQYHHESPESQCLESLRRSNPVSLRLLVFGLSYVLADEIPILYVELNSFPHQSITYRDVAIHDYACSKMAGAMALPAETWLQIAHFSKQRDLAALVRTNRRLHSLVNRELYRTAMQENLYPITLGAVKAGNLDTLKVAAAYGADLDMPFPYPLCDQVLGIGIEPTISTGGREWPKKTKSTNGHGLLRYMLQSWRVDTKSLSGS